MRPLKAIRSLLFPKKPDNILINMLRERLSFLFSVFCICPLKANGHQYLYRDGEHGKSIFQ